jgi:2-dehydropantoate 2-reductase
MGAGAMGTILGARLTQAGLNVELVDADAAHVAALGDAGANVTGTVFWTTRVRALQPGTMQGRYDLAFLLVKQTHNPTALAQLEPHLHRRSVVCTLQNGVPEPAVAAALGAGRTLGAAVTWASTLLGPGRVRSTSEPGNWRALLGTLAGEGTPAREALPMVRDVLSIMCACEIVSDLAAMRWSKLLLNASFSGMSAALGCTFGELLLDEKAFACVQHVARECLRVSEAQGVRLSELWPGVDFRSALDFGTEAERSATAGNYRRLCSPVRGGKSSMLQDLEAGRQTEVDFINGLLSRTGRQVGVATPMSDTVLRVVKAIESGERSPAFANLDLFELGQGD